MASRRSFLWASLAVGMQGLLPRRAAAADIPVVVPATLDELVAKVRQLRASGASREAIARWLSEVIDARIEAPNLVSERLTMSDGKVEAWNQFPDTGLTYDQVARLSWEKGVGQCGEHACIAYYVCKMSGFGGNPRILSIGGKSTHDFVVIDMEQGANSSDPRTWGDKALVVDGWQGHAMDRKKAWTDGYISDGGKRRPADKTSARDGQDGWDVEAPTWVVDEKNKDSLKDVSSGSGGCFIATAAYGSPCAEQVQALRDWRDRVLVTTAGGRGLVWAYYRISPPLARFVRTSDRRRAAVRSLLLNRLVAHVRRHRAPGAGKEGP